MPNFKEGVVWVAMAPQVETALEIIDQIHVRIAKRCAIVTSARDGTHGPTSLHYSGRAIDIRINDLKPNVAKKLADSLRLALGEVWDVVLEVDHIHMEYDPT